MKPLQVFLSALFFLPLVAAAKNPKARLDEALKTAAETKKDLMVVFSGASWNKTSKDFEEKVLKSPDFQKGSGEKFLQLLIDIPPSRQEAHQDLLDFEKTYRFQSIPTVILMDSLGRPYAYTGSSKNDPGEFLKHLTELHQIRVGRDQNFQSALKAEGKKRAELLVAALKTLPQQIIAEFYQKELEMIAEADPKGETAYVAEIRKAQALEKEKARFNKLFGERKYDEIIKVAQTEAAKLQGEDAQRLKLYAVQALYAQKKYDAALQEVVALKKIAPDSELGKRADQFTSQITAAKKRQERMAEAAKKPKKPVVSKPVAIVADIEQLRQDARKVEEELAAAKTREQEQQQKQNELTQKISAMEKDLKALQEKKKSSAEALKKATAEREKLARKSQAMKDVVANHEAMEKRKREVAELEKKAAELQKQAEELRQKAEEVKKGK